MFLNLLSPKEKAGFLSLCRQMILSDEMIANSEVVSYKSLRYEMEILEEMTEEELKNEIKQLPKNTSEILEIFESQRNKIAVLIELIALAFSDGKFVTQEKSLVFEIANQFGFSKQETEGYIEWALKVYEA